MMAFLVVSVSLSDPYVQLSNYRHCPTIGLRLKTRPTSLFHGRIGRFTYDRLSCVSPSNAQRRATSLRSVTASNLRYCRCRRRAGSDNAIRRRQSAQITTGLIAYNVSRLTCTIAYRHYYRLLPISTSPPIRMRIIAICVSVRLSVRSFISTCLNILYMLIVMAMARFFSDDNAIRYVLPVCG